jgi:hypothetical protein
MLLRDSFEQEIVALSLPVSGSKHFAGGHRYQEKRIEENNDPNHYTQEVEEEEWRRRRAHTPSRTARKLNHNLNSGRDDKWFARLENRAMAGGREPYFPYFPYSTYFHWLIA